MLHYQKYRSDYGGDVRYIRAKMRKWILFKERGMAVSSYKDNKKRVLKDPKVKAEYDALQCWFVFTI